MSAVPQPLGPLFPDLGRSTFLPTKLNLRSQLNTFQVQIPWQTFPIILAIVKQFFPFCELDIWHFIFTYFDTQVLDTSYFDSCLNKSNITMPYISSYHLSHASRTQFRSARYGSFYPDAIISDSWVSVTWSYCSFQALKTPCALNGLRGSLMFFTSNLQETQIRNIFKWYYY